MKNKYLFVTVMLTVILAACIALSGFCASRAESGQKESRIENDFHIVTSFYPMYIAVKNIAGGCSGVSLQNLSEPQTGCLHDYQLTAVDMKLLSGADVFVVNGGGIESFLSDAAGRCPNLAVVNACESLELLPDNAHAWMSIASYMVQVQTITDRLSALDKDKEHQKTYQQNCAAYLKKLEALRQKQQDMAEKLSVQNIVIFHEAFAYIAKDYGMTVSGSMDLDEERQASAGEAADIIVGIRENDVRLILAEERYGAEMARMVKEETGADVIYLDTCVRGSYDADSYLKAMNANLDRIAEFLSLS